MVTAKTLKIDPGSPDESAIEFASTLLKDGGLVAFPTETVYGIGVNFLNKKAVERLYRIKKRPKEKPFTIHVASLETINDMRCQVSPFAQELIKRFWPGPLTLILNSEKTKIGFRMPSNEIAKAFISKSGVPVAAPSANMSGIKPPVEADEVLRNMGDYIDLVLDGGKTKIGRESTIVDASCFPYKILRKGAVPEEDIAGIWNRVK